LTNYEISQEIQNQIDFAMNDMASDLYGTDVDPVNLEAPIYGQQIGSLVTFWDQE